MIVDEKGKLFGKINLLDCLIVLLVVCVIAAAVILSKVGSAKDGNSIPLTYTVEVKNKDAGYFAHLIEGEKVIDGVTKEALGEIVSVTTQPAVSVAQADDTLISVNIEDKLDGYVNIKANASVSYPDLMVGKEAIKIGKSMAIRSESAAIHGYIVGMDYDADLLKEMR